MTKRKWVLLASFLLLASCTMRPTELDEEEKESATESIFEDYQNFVSDYFNSEEPDSTSQSEDNDASPLYTPDETIPTLKVGDLITKDDVCEFSFDYINITNDVLPMNPERVYSHYQADVGMTYVDVCLYYKNLNVRDIGSDDIIKGTLLFAEKYQYSGFAFAEENNRGDFTYSTYIKPLTGEYVHYLFEIPEHLTNSSASLIAVVEIAGDKYSIPVLDGGNQFQLSIGYSGTEKKSGELAVNEVVELSDNSIFFLEYANVTSDVVPPSPDGYYSHYPADDGMKYFDLCFVYTNLKARSVSSDDVFKSALLSYAGKYEYRGTCIAEEDNRGDFTYSSYIKPLCTEYIHLLFSVPDEVINGQDSILISYIINGSEYTYTYR